ncbi:MAG TPA: hypothetical protein VGL97_18880 [Bryobacteraceae bacterium]|jgi:hypothetical protein
MSEKRLDNERKVCDAVARAIEDIMGDERSNAYSPEDNAHKAPIEYVFNVHEVTYAIEHTVVEAFDGQIRADVDFDNFIKPIVKALDGKLPSPGLYNVYFTAHPTKGMKPRALTQTQTAIIDWIRKAAGDLHAEHPEEPTIGARPFGHTNSRRDRVQDVDVFLQRETRTGLADRHRGRLFACRFEPKAYEELRLRRLIEAANKKLPKLRAWRDRGAHTILVLENRDISLSNHMVIYEAVQAALRERSDYPDEVWLVDTSIETEWTVWCLIRDGMEFPDEDTETRYREFDPANLENVSSRATVRRY